MCALHCAGKLLSSADVNIFDITSGRQASSDATMSLTEFCKNGDLEGVKAGIESGADVNAKDEYGQTGLMLAVNHNHKSVVELLISIPNIDVNLKSDWGSYSALHLAVIRNNFEAFKLLVKISDINVDTAMVASCRMGDLEGVKAFLQRGADVNTRNGEFGLISYLGFVH